MILYYYENVAFDHPDECTKKYIQKLWEKFGLADKVRIG